jgi:hypothetical protein
VALAGAGAGCSGKTIVAVDPYPCSSDDTTGCPPGLLDDLVGYWRLDDAPGSATAQDGSGWGNDGTLVGLDPTAAWMSGGPAGGFLAPEAKGYVKVAPSASIDSVTDQVTVAAWIYIEGTIATYATAISRQIGGGYGQHYHLSVNDQQLAGLFITTPATGQVFITSPTAVAQQTWVHLAGTYDGSRAHLFVDGAEVNSAPITGPFATETDPLILAGNGNAADNAVSELVPGRLDEVMLYRRALGSDEIARLASGALLPSTAAHADAGGQ